MEDCKEQKYETSFNAEQYVLRSSMAEENDLLSYDLGKKVIDENWVSNIEINQRYVKVDHAEGVGLMVIYLNFI